MKTKHLIKLYEEYKKIGQPKGYSDGGDVKPSPTPSPEEQGFFDSVKKAFSAPAPAPKQEQSLEDKYSKIRARNRTNMSGETSSTDQSYAGGGMVQSDINNNMFADGATSNAVPTQNNMNQFSLNQGDQYNTDSAPSSAASGLSFLQKFMGSSPESSGSQSSDPNAAQNQQISKGLSSYYSGLGKGYADGGEVENQKMDLGDIPINASAAPVDELPDYTAEEADANKVVDQKAALEDAVGEDDKSEEEKPEDTSEEDDKEESKDDSRDPADKELNDQEKQDIAESGFSGKAEGIPSPRDPNELAKAQAKRASMISGDKALQLGNLAGSGIAGSSGAKVNPLPASYFESLDRGANLPVQDYQEQIANQQNDPNSAMSKVVKDYYKGKGINVPENASAADITKVAPYYMKDAALQTAIQKVLTQQQGALTRNTASNKTKTDIADKNRLIKERQLKIEQQKADAATKNAEGNKELKAQAAQDRALSQTKTMLESARGNPAAAQAEKDLYSVDKANSLFKLYPNLDKIPDAQVNLITSEIAKIAQGGVPPGHEMDGLKPNTPESKLQKLFGQLQNEPKPANLGAYLKELKKYTDALHGDATKVIHDKYGRVIESSKKQLGDDNYKALQDQYLSRFNPPEQKEHPQDKQAIEWAKDNMGKDPRAAAILKANGIN